ncbi:MAG: hypothetical protein WKG32_08305 [Gemmatimonadaceae bacterium]
MTRLPREPRQNAPAHVSGALAALPAAFRADAVTLRDYGDERGALLLERVAGRVGDAIARAAAELLTLERAAELGGYSADHLGRLLTSGVIPNAGRKGAPRIRLADLPRKAGALRPASDLGIVGATKAQVARRVVTSDSARVNDDG